jgi:hypothetical protein
MKRVMCSGILFVLAAAAFAGPPVVQRFRIDTYRIFPGQGAYLSWEVSGASSITIEPGLGLVSPAGRWILTPRETTTYTLKAAGPEGEASATATLVVIPSADTPRGGVLAEGLIISEGPAYERGDPVFYFKGIVRNNGRAAARGVRVYVYMRDASGVFITHAWTFADENDLEPGESSAWTVMVTDEGGSLQRTMSLDKTTVEIKADKGR